MKRKIILFVGTLIFLGYLSFPFPGSANNQSDPIIKSENVLPQNTIILGNEIELRFSQDFSVNLKHVRLDWVVLDRPRVPDAAQKMNIILIGHPDDGFAGEIMREILSAMEIQTIIETTDQFVVLEKENPWREERNIYICSGADYFHRRNAAEAMVRQLIADSPPASDWIHATYDYEPGDDFQEYIEGLQYQWMDTELPLKDLMIDATIESPLRISADQALEDVDRLFSLFSHGYSGFAFFNQDGEFELARTQILRELALKENWSKNAFSNLITKHLGFITDCHLNIDDQPFVSHHDFWYDTEYELQARNDGYQYQYRGQWFTIFSINGSEPSSYLFPSLNAVGDPIYRIGTLSVEKPNALNIIAIGEEGETQFQIKLKRSDFGYYTEDIFHEDILGGIPVIRVRSFGDSYPQDLNSFAETARAHRGDPVLIVDIRGNGGGNEKWPISWIQGLTGRYAEAVFTSSELESKTTMAGRANAFIYWGEKTADSSFFSSNAKLYTQKAERFEVGQRQPSWTKTHYPDFSLISNDTTVVLVTNNLVASAGEGMVLRSSQVENVLVVGENTRGCLTFGNISLHQLPHSKIKVWMPINFGVFLDQEFREGIGLAPDLWVPAEDAVNSSIAAIRKGTITTNQPLTEETLAQAFKRESPWRQMMQLEPKSWLLIGVLTVGGTVWAYLLRKKTPVLLVIGAGWIAFSFYWSTQRPEKFVGIVFLMIGGIWLLWGVINLLMNQIGRQQDHLV